MALVEGWLGRVGGPSSAEGVGVEEEDGQGGEASVFALSRLEMISTLRGVATSMTL